MIFIMRKNLHFRRIPDYINRELDGIESPFVVVSATLKVSLEDIAKGEYRNLGITINEGELSFNPSFLPPPANGTHSRTNLNGKIIPLKDKPKVPKKYYWISPNFGDFSKGTHLSSRTIMVYQKLFIAPREWRISLQVLKQDEKFILLKVAIDTILDRNSPTFNDDLFFAINLLQEHVRDSHVYDANATIEDYLEVTSLGWEIFPPGSVDRVINMLKKQIHTNNPAKQERIEERVKFIKSLNPIELYVGKGMNNRYFGAKFKDDLVVFENEDYGNAIYVLFGNWEELSQKSRTEILCRPDKDFVRIPHSKNWKWALSQEIRKHMKK